ncbi:Mn2+/Fe2+ transporter [Halomontanus rarus]|uniref:Mn2+/Fe2+ transporter n=1 Tax=Halomontanus rarus TaxID=3034020 RepID=UPI0023E89D6E|nr:Mn2+/Fe2+ transporter [Halovivax sp. TS33]
MDTRQNEPRSNSAVKNVMVVTAVVLASTFIGIWSSFLTDNLGAVVTWIWIGLGLSAVYLLYDIANSVKQLEYKL